MRIEALAGRNRDEIGDVVDEVFLNVASVLIAEERRWGACLRCVGLNGCDEVILQPMQVFSRFDDDTCKANRGGWDSSPNLQTTISWIATQAEAGMGSSTSGAAPGEELKRGR